ncbi:MAG: metallophosphoesterase family protein [bacterium]
MNRLLKRAIFYSVIIILIFSLYCDKNGQQINRHIIFYGDSRTNHDVHLNVVNAIMTKEPEITFHTGDLVNDGNSKSDWDIFNKITYELRKISLFYPSLGNHENESQLYFDNFDLPGNKRWYDVDYFNIRFIVLDTNIDFSLSSEQYIWLEGTLKNSPYKDIIAVFHHPPYYESTHDPEISEKVQEYLIPLFEQYGVDIVFSGHHHNYQRFYVNGIYYIITGGGGAPLLDKDHDEPNCQKFIKTYHFCLLTVSADNMTLDVYDSDLNLIDDVVIDRD